MKTSLKNQNKTTRKAEWIGKQDDSDVQDAEVKCIISVRVERVKNVRCTVRCKFVCD